jgi:glycerol-3-phosphate acyltransferase PlsY
LTEQILTLTALPLAGYLAGSIPFAFLLARGRGVDLRQVGSGNIGATNLGRALGARWGYLCFVLDVAKGALPVLAGGWWVGAFADVSAPPAPLPQLAWVLAGLGAILGHVLPVWLGFRGGKGVATSLGAVLAYYPYFTFPGLIALGVWVLVTLASRYVSLGSIAAAAAFLPAMALLNAGRMDELLVLAVFASAMVVLIVLRHRSNIVRLVQGREHRIGSKRSADTGPSESD